MTAPAPLGPVSQALEFDLSLWGQGSGVLAQTAREIAARLDSAASQRDLVELSRELRQLVKQIRDAMPVSSESALDGFLRDIAAEGFGR